MKEKVVLLNIIKFKNDKGEALRLEFYLDNKDAIASNTSFKGYSTNACFYNDSTLFDKLPKELFGKSVDVTFKAIQSVRNPLKSTSVIENIFYNGNNIRLLQSE